MERFAANTDCVLTFNLTENGYEEVVSTSWKLYDEAGNELTSSEANKTPDIDEENTPESSPDAPTRTNQSEELPTYPEEENVENFVVKIDKSFNTLGENEQLGYRRLVLNIETKTGTAIQFIEYLLVGLVELTPMVNSYQTYGEAQLTAAKISGLQDWQEVPTEDKVSALITAFNKIGKLNFVIPSDDDCGMEIPNLNKLSIEEFKALNSAFVEAIKRAQVVEANSVSGYNAAEEMKRGNILSYTIGETSQMFKTGNTYVSTLSSDAMDILDGYIVRKIRIARA